MAAPPRGACARCLETLAVLAGPGLRPGRPPPARGPPGAGSTSWKLCASPVLRCGPEPRGSGSCAAWRMLRLRPAEPECGRAIFECDGGRGLGGARSARPRAKRTVCEWAHESESLAHKERRHRSGLPWAARLSVRVSGGPVLVAIPPGVRPVPVPMAVARLPVGLVTRVRVGAPMGAPAARFVMAAASGAAMVLVVAAWARARGATAAMAPSAVGGAGAPVAVPPAPLARSLASRHRRRGGGGGGGVGARAGRCRAAAPTCRASHRPPPLPSGSECS